MENKSYVLNGIGFGALFEAMVTLAEADIQAGKKKIETADRIEATGHNLKHVKPLREHGEAMVNEAREGLAEWLTILRKLDIADAIIEN